MKTWYFAWQHEHGSAYIVRETEHNLNTSSGLVAFIREIEKQRVQKVVPTYWREMDEPDAQAEIDRLWADLLAANHLIDRLLEFIKSKPNFTGWTCQILRDMDEYRNPPNQNDGLQP